MTTTTTVLPPPVQQKFDAKLLSRPMQKNIHGLFAMRKELEENVGDTLRMRRYTNLQRFPVPLGPAFLNPPTQVLNAVDIDAKVQFYGTSVLITKQVTLINEDPVLNETVSLLAQALRETEDQLIRDMLESTAAFVNAVGGTNGDNPTELTRADVDGVVAILQNNNADFITDYIQGEDRFGTGPVRDAYFAMASTRLIGQLEQVTGFQNKAQYPNPEKTLSAEWGTIGNVRWVLSSAGAVIPGGSMNGNDIFPSFISGQQAYAVVELNGFTAQFMYVPPVPSAADPLGLRQYGSCRFADVPRLTNDAWLIALRSTLS